MVRTIARQAHPLVGAAFVACALVQVFLAGIGVFEGPAGFVTHREFGYLFGWLTLAILVLALVGREPRRIVGLAVLLLVQFALQSVLILQRQGAPMIAALHPVNGFLLLVVAIVITRWSWAVRREAAPARAVGTRATRAASAEAR
jgi:hypothetical protein